MFQKDMWQCRLETVVGGLDPVYVIWTFLGHKPHMYIDFKEFQSPDICQNCGLSSDARGFQFVSAVTGQNMMDKTPYTALCCDERCVGELEKKCEGHTPETTGGEWETDRFIWLTLPRFVIPIWNFLPKFATRRFKVFEPVTPQIQSDESDVWKASEEELALWET